METFEQKTTEDQVLDLSVKKNTSFAGDVFKIASGTTLAQVITVLAAPFLTRIYVPDAYGLLALFGSITGIIGVIACMRYELSIMLPENDGEAANLLGVSLVFTLFVSLFTIPVIWLGKEHILKWLAAPGLAPYLWLIPPTVFVSGVFLALNYWNSRTRHFGRLSIARVTSSVATTSMTLGVGYAGYATGGTLIGAIVAGQAVATTVLGGQIWRDEKKLFIESIRWPKMLSGIRRHRKFALYGPWTGLLNTASWHLPAFLLSAFFSSEVVGYYALGLRILQLPMSLVGGAIAQVFFQRASEAYRRSTLTSFVENALRRLVYIGLFPMLMLSIIGRDLYAVVFGKMWAEAGVYTQILSLFMFANFIAAPLGQLFSILEKQEAALFANIALFVFRLIALWWGGKTGNVIFTLCLFSASGALVYGAYSIWLSTAAGISSKMWGAIISRALVLSLSFLVPAWFLCSILELRGLALLSTYGVVFIGYYIWVITHDSELHKILCQLLPCVKEKNEIPD